MRDPKSKKVTQAQAATELSQKEVKKVKRDKRKKLV